MKVTPELLTAIYAYEPGEERANARTWGEPLCCLACGQVYHLAAEMEPTPLCDDCAHEFVQEVAAQYVARPQHPIVNAGSQSAPSHARSRGVARRHAARKSTGHKEKKR